jgi:hypothetical protein
MTHDSVIDSALAWTRLSPRKLAGGRDGPSHGENLLEVYGRAGVVDDQSRVAVI